MLVGKVAFLAGAWNVRSGALLCVQTFDWSKVIGEDLANSDRAGVEQVTHGALIRQITKLVLR